MSETLTRAELAELIYSEVGISKTEASEIVDQFFEEIICVFKKSLLFWKERLTVQEIYLR